MCFAIKNSSTDGLDLPMAVNTDIAIVQGLEQTGRNEVDREPRSFGAPVRLHTGATQRFEAALKKHAGFTGVPVFGTVTGYQPCGLAILGTQHAGNPPT